MVKSKNYLIDLVILLRGLAGADIIKVSSLVSIIIPVYNRSHLLIEAVSSVIEQTYRPIQIIIVDDGSTDDTSTVALKMAGEYPKDIIYIKTSNGGPGYARETGRQIATGEFIQYLDSDDLLLPDKFEIQVSGLKSHPECSVAYGKTRYYHISDRPRDLAWKQTGEFIDRMFPAFLQSRLWGTSTPLYRRTVTDRAGPWTTLRNEEDWEYDCRIASQDIKLYYCNQFVSEQRDHGEKRLSHDGSCDPAKLRDRATAHSLILKHARSAGITNEVPEMQHFARELFLLSRQCGAADLADESMRLFELARTASIPEISSGLQFRAYRLASLLLGWRAMGKLSAQLDKFRSDPA